jgi:CelD/BcsL family acetyltransferase involved in cellulose biosynthesis
LPLQIRVLRSLAECRAIKNDWSHLVKEEGCGIHGFDVSATFEWTEALWCELLGGEPQIVLVAEDEYGICGLLPCSISRETIGKIPHRKLSSIGSIYELRTGFLVGGSAEILEKLLDFLIDHIAGWDTFVFRVIDSSPSDLALQKVIQRRKFALDERRCWTSPYFPIPPDATQVLDQLSSKMRFNLRRGEKKLRELGNLVMKIYETEDAASEFLGIMVTVEKQSWKLAAGTAINTNQKQQKHYSIVTPAMAKCGWFLGAALMLDTRPLAFIYGYAFEGVFSDEKESYVDQFKIHGPGNVLKAMFLQELVRRGITTYDYGGISDPHKARWTDQSYSRHIYILYNSSIRGQMVKASVAAKKWWISLKRTMNAAKTN